jgi:hypothetical protein
MWYRVAWHAVTDVGHYYNFFICVTSCRKFSPYNVGQLRALTPQSTRVTHCSGQSYIPLGPHCLRIWNSLSNFFLLSPLSQLELSTFINLTRWVIHCPPVLILSSWGPLQWVNPLQPSIRSAGQSFFSLLLCCCSSSGCNMGLLWFVLG